MVTTNAVSKIVQIPTSAAVDAFFIARMTCYPSSTVRLPANARHLARTAAQFFEAKKSRADPRRTRHRKVTRQHQPSAQRFGLSRLIKQGLRRNGTISNKSR